MKIKKVLLSVAATFFVTAGTWAQTVIPSYVPTNGLVGWWPFNGNANDLSVNGNNGTVNGATLTADRYGNANKAYSFDGVDDFINLPKNNDTTFTFSLWYKINSNPLITIPLIDAYNSNWEFHIGDNNMFGSYKFRSYSQIGYQDFYVTGGFLLPNVWTNITCTFSNNVVSIYSFGQFITQLSLSQNIYVSAGIFSVAKTVSYSAPGHFYMGLIDDIGIWNRALTPCEIKKLYTSGSFSVSSSASNTICVGQSLNLTAAGAPTYTWNTGATSQSISVSPTVSTVYTVSTTYSAGCTDSRTFSVTVNACTGLNETEITTNSVRIFPNPAKEQLNISISNTAVMGKTYSITNALGQVVATGVFNKQIMELSIQQLSAGLYQLNIDGMQENYKFIKE
jgi:hypothetical protein